MWRPCLSAFGASWKGTTAVLRGKSITGGHRRIDAGKNEFACGLVMVIPFCWYGRSIVKNYYLRAVLLVMTFGSMAAVLMTFSRAGAISLMVIILMVALQAKHKALTLLLIVLAMVRQCSIWPAIASATEC